MNVERLLAVKQAILDHPKQGTMAGWYHYSPHSNMGTPGNPDLLTDCGTAGCICGWALAIFAPGQPRCENPAVQAAALLGLTPDQAGPLFYLDSWPAELLERYNAITTGDGFRVGSAVSVLMAERIDRFLLKHGAVISEPASHPAETPQLSGEVVR